MNNTMICDEELGARCFDILAREVGPVEAERFIAYVNRERIDYTKWQQNLFDGQSIEAIATEARATAAKIRRARAESIDGSNETVDTLYDKIKEFSAKRKSAPAESLRQNMEL